MGTQDELEVGKQRYLQAQELLRQAALSEEDVSSLITGSALNEAAPQPDTSHPYTSENDRSQHDKSQHAGASGSAACVEPRPGSSAHLLLGISAELRGQHSVWHRAKVALLSHFAGCLRRSLEEERRARQAGLQAAQRREEALTQQLRTSEQVSPTSFQWNAAAPTLYPISWLCIA